MNDDKMMARPKTMLQAIDALIQMKHPGSIYGSSTSYSGGNCSTMNEWCIQKDKNLNTIKRLYITRSNAA